jgi:glycerate kinase
MRLRVLIVPDKFKGTLSARQAAAAIERGWRKARPKDKLTLLPMSDGGDGFGEVMSDCLSAIPRTVTTCDAAHHSCRARWWWQPRTRIAILDTARVIGLAMLPPGRFHPFQLDTYGLGDLLRAALKAGARRCLVGLGGSATNDAGFGLARAFGWKFEDPSGRPIERWTDLVDLARVSPPVSRSKMPELVIAVDVQNPLLGSGGATRVYGPQKGLKPREFAAAERALGRLASVMRRDRRFDYARVPGAGAAGGLGFGFLAFLGGQLVPGFELFAREVGLEQTLHRTDLVITGEGAVDLSTSMGKGAGCVAKVCSQMRLPCLGLSGIINRASGSEKMFTQARALTDLTTVQKARTKPAQWLEVLARQTAAEWIGEG